MKRAISLILALILLMPTIVSADTPKLFFKDTTAGAWYEDGVNYCFEHGYINGTDAGVFTPAGKLTRAMSVRMLYTLGGSSEEEYDCGFTDVSDESWYASSVKWAFYYEITKGTTDTLFSPNLNVTRQDFVTMLFRYNSFFGHKNRFEGESNSVSEYDDSADVSQYALDALNWALEYDIINGYTDNTLLPHSTITRSEAAVMIYKYDTVFGHRWISDVVVERTCSQDGLTTYNCDICEESRAVTTSGYHIWGDQTTVVPPSCTKKGSAESKCLVCNEAITIEIPEIGYHSWDSFEITKEPTCVDNGNRRYTCSVCQGHFDQVISPLGHKWDDFEIIKDATCTNQGVKRIYCTRCKDYYEVPLKEYGHSWDSFVITKEASCTETGIRKYICSRCGGSFDQTIEKKPHSWDNFEIVEAATCTKTGIRRYKCSNCSGTFDQTIPLKSHEWVMIEEVKGANCKTPGSVKYQCSVCNGTFDQVSYNGPHEWIVSSCVPATQNYKGKENLVCSFCSADKTVITDRLPRTEGYDSNGDGILTIDEYFGSFGMVDMLTEHKSDYIGTPYVALANYVDRPYMLLHNKGQYPDSPGMNCTGFVASAINRSGGNLNRVKNYYKGGYGNGYNWLNTFFSVGIEYYKFYSADAALRSGLLKKGDIMFFMPPDKVPEGELKDCHFGIFWGDTSSHDLIWHSTGATKHNYNYGVRGMKNQITRISSGTIYDYILVFPLQR